MHTHTTEGKALAIVAGAFCAFATVGILLEDVVLHGAPITLKHGLSVVVIGVTIAMGHLASNAKAAGRYMAMCGFSVLFVAGTLLTVHSSVGRQAEHVMVASAEVEAADKARAIALAGLEKEQARLDKARADLASECKTGKGKRCDGIRETIGVYDAAVRGHKADLERLGPARVAVPEAKRAGELAAVFGADPVKVEAATVLLVPFLTTLFLEIGSIICLGYGFRPVRKVLANDNLQTSYPIPEPLPPATAIPPALKGENVIDWARRFERQHGRKPRLDETTTAFPDVSRSTCYRRLKAA